MSDVMLQRRNGAIINSDDNGYKKYKMAREKAKEQNDVRTMISAMNQKIGDIEKSIEEIREMMNGPKS